MIAYFLVLLIIIISSALPFALLWDIKQNWKKSWTTRHKIILVLVILCAAKSFITEKYKIDADVHAKMERHIDIMKQAFILMKQNPDIEACDNKIHAGEIKTNVAAYLCKKPFIIEIYKQAGVQYEGSLEAISNTFMEFATKRDKGESTSSEDLNGNLFNIISHDESEH